MSSPPSTPGGGLVRRILAASPFGRLTSASDTTNDTTSQQEPANRTATAIRVRGKEYYGGRLMYGGSNNSLLYAPRGVSMGGSSAVNSSSYLRRSNRLLAATPYASAMKNKRKGEKAANPDNSLPCTSSSHANSSFLSSSLNDSTMLRQSPNESLSLSSTAKSILETLDKMTPPTKEVKKPVLPRAERRRALAEELLECGSLLTPNASRRRPNLGRSTGNDNNTPYTRTPLSGPPLRNNYSITPACRRLPQSVHRKQEKTVIELNNSVEKSAAPGKIRAKVGERAKGRAEKGISDQDYKAPQLSSGSNNPFVGLNSLPAFNFTKSPLVQKSEIERNQSILTNPDLNRSPVSTKVVNSKPEKLFTSPVTVMERVFNTTEDKSESATTTTIPPTSNHQFKFSKPDPLPEAVDISRIKSADQKFVFSNPKEVSRLEPAKPALLLSSNHNNHLPDLTAGAPSDKGSPPEKNNSAISFNNTNFKAGTNSTMKLKEPYGKSQLFKDNNYKLPDVTAPAGLISTAKTLSQGSVMDILGKSSGAEAWKNSSSSFGNKQWH